MTDSNSIPAMIQETHRIYCALTSTTPNLKLWERDFYEFVQAGFTSKDMEQVLIWIMRENKKASEPRYHKSMSLLKLVSDLRVFDAYLAEAQAANRNHKPLTAKAQVLQQFRRTAEPDGGPAPRIVKDVMKRMV